MHAFLRFVCPSCGKIVKAFSEQAGKRVRCPGKACGAVLVVPAPAALPAAAPHAPGPAARPAPRRLRLPAVGELGLASLGLLLLAGAAYRWLWLPSAAERACYEDYLRTGNDLVDLHNG